jgi:uncharacterized damage-inducible protein DinB
MAHPLVTQLRFSRSEFRRALENVSSEEASKRLLPVNSIGWMVAHLAWHEHSYWIERAQGKSIIPRLKELAGYRKPASTPPIDEMWAAWHTVTQAADVYLEILTVEILKSHLVVNEKPLPASVGDMLQRMIYHYWYHIGESQAVRQLLGHKNLPEFVGDIEALAPYTPENV